MICGNKNCGKEIEEGAKICPHCGFTIESLPNTDRPTLYALKPSIILAGRFKLIRRLGTGGMGDVWLAQDQQLDEPVAVKILRTELAGDEQAIIDLMQEVKLTRKLRHPHIVAMHDYHMDKQKGLHFISMEYVKGQSLAQVREKQGGKLPLDHVMHWTKQLAGAIDYAHKQNVLHRDIKPGNILLDMQGNVKLADFGIARIAKDTHTKVTGEVSSGTLVYMSPEQLMGEKLNSRSDLYSLAASIYELLAGHPPFYTGSIPTQIQTKCAPPIEGVSSAMNKVLHRGLAKKAVDRYESVKSFFDELLNAPKNLVNDKESTIHVTDNLAQDISTATTLLSKLRASFFAFGSVITLLVIVGVVVLFLKAKMRGNEFITATTVTQEQIRIFPVVTDSLTETGSPSTSETNDNLLTPIELNTATPQVNDNHTASGVDAFDPDEYLRNFKEKIVAGTERTFDGIEMIWCPSGKFLMGSPNDEIGRDNDETQHEVILSEGFWLGKYEVTQSEWETVMGTSVRLQKDEENETWPIRGEGSNFPMYYVSWDECQEFIRKLNHGGQNKFRLPTEAEWEYACRAGNTTAYFFGNEGSIIGVYAWYKDNSSNRTHIVGSTKPNMWGLYDMHGNVWEWCQDWDGEYPLGSITNPSGPASSSGRVNRGGGWNNNGDSCRSANRNSHTTDYRSSILGLRLAKSY